MPKARLMGILNATPDSFYAKSRVDSVQAALERAHQMHREGADILDIGGESTRPYAAYVPEDEEMQRVIPIIKELSQQLPIPLSIDTYKPNVAAAALKAGAKILNDITGFRDPTMRRLAADSGVEICVMHMQGDPTNMQDNPTYPEGIIPHLITWFKRQIDLLLKEGVKENQIILDPGIGFGKTVAHNLEIIHNLPDIKALGFPVLVGGSRKIFIAKILQKPADHLLAGTLAANTLALWRGADIIRVYDIAEHRDAINIVDRVTEQC